VPGRLLPLHRWERRAGRPGRWTRERPWRPRRSWRSRRRGRWAARPFTGGPPGGNPLVDEKGEGGAKVSVNLPIGAAEAALDVVQSEALEHGKLHMGDLKVADLRRIWNEVRAGGNADLVTV
jgi:hypothetical protein